MSDTSIDAVGSRSSRLIIIRGNSGSGKSALARAIRAERPRGVAIIGQDMLRRDILHVRDHPGNLSVSYIDMSARFALEHGLDVVVEGILYAKVYGDMLSKLREDHRGITCAYYYDLELEETLRRHRTKDIASEVTEEQLSSWYRSRDLIVGLNESVFGASLSERDALERVLTDAQWSASG